MTHSPDLTGIPDFRNDSPAAAHHPVPLEEVTWGMIALFAGVVGLIGVGLFGLLVLLIPGQEQPSAATPNGDPQPPPYSRGAVL